MKDNLLEMLLTLFEQTLTQLKETYVPEVSKKISKTIPKALVVHQEEIQPTHQAHDAQGSSASNAKKTTLEMLWFRSPDQQSMRVFTPEEQIKLTHASHQFLKRLGRLDVLAPDAMEMVINRLMFSESRFVNLQETKWAVRQVLAEHLPAEQLAFLDLVLYQKEDRLPLH